MEKTIVTWLGFGVLLLAFFISMSPTSYAQLPQQGECIGVQTDSGQEHPRPPGWDSRPGIIEIVASSDEISPTEPVTLYVNSNGWGHPNYTWGKDGTGYTLSDSETYGDFVPIILSVVGGTCGTQYSPYVTVTVTDTLGAEDSIVIRNEGGKWVTLYSYQASNVNNSDCSAGCSNTGTILYAYYDMDGGNRWYTIAESGYGWWCSDASGVWVPYVCYYSPCYVESPACGSVNDCGVPHGGSCTTPFPPYVCGSGCWVEPQHAYRQQWGCP